MFLKIICLFFVSTQTSNQTNIMVTNLSKRIHKLGKNGVHSVYNYCSFLCLFFMLLFLFKCFKSLSLSNLYLRNRFQIFNVGSVDQQKSLNLSLVNTLPTKLPTVLSLKLISQQLLNVL